MPKYEYACKSCGERLEVVQSFTDPALTECPNCGGALRKVFSAPSISFKGSGFYRTDNRQRRSESTSDSKSSDSKSSADAKPSTAGGTDGKSEPAKKEAAPAAESKPKAAEA